MITYNVVDNTGIAAETVTREVIVVDTVAPVITLLGESSVTIALGSDYQDAGATAFDNFDGDITGNITTVNLVDTALAGSYSVTYDVTDANGNVAITVIREVNIVVDDGQYFLYDSLVFDEAIVNDELITPSLRVVSIENEQETFISINGNNLGDQNNSSVITLSPNLVTIKKGLFVYSDIRLKANIKSLGLTSSRLFNIVPRMYNMINQGSKLKFGFIAQEVKSYYPELINDSGQYLRVNYQGFIPILINSIKEQNDNYLSIKERIKKLKEKIHE